MGAFMEELLSRASIDMFIVLMDGIRAKAFWAIPLTSSVLVIPRRHHPNPLAQLAPGIFSEACSSDTFYKGQSILCHGFTSSPTRDISGIWLQAY